ncbi:MAG TPA: TetR/AcrR family transcriptional regulator [Phenylobacterium sp.]
MDAKPTVKRQRRSRKEGADFRNQLIAAARDLFANDGFESVSIRKIAERASCPPMTFYVYFKSKRALLRHIWADVFANLWAVCSAAALTEQRPEDKLRRFVLAMVEFWLEHPDSYRIVFMNQDFVESDDDELYMDMLGANARFGALEELIEAGVAAGVVRPLDPIAVSQVLVAATVGVGHALITVPEYPWRRDALIANMLDLLLRGLEATPHGRP